jgi:hypothetical protein
LTPETSAEKPPGYPKAKRQKRVSVGETGNGLAASESIDETAQIRFKDLAKDDPDAARIRSVKRAQAEGKVNPAFVTEEVLMMNGGFFVREKCYELVFQQACFAKDRLSTNISPGA